MTFDLSRLQEATRPSSHGNLRFLAVVDAVLVDALEHLLAHDLRLTSSSHGSAFDHSLTGTTSERVVGW